MTGCGGWGWGSSAPLGRHTRTPALAALGLGDPDPGAFSRMLGRGRLRYERLSRGLRAQTLTDLPASGPYTVVVDGVQVPRSSRTMPGTAWLPCPRTPPWKRASHRAQFFVPLAAYRTWGHGRHPRRTRTLWWAGAPRGSLATLWRGYHQAFARCALPHPRRAAPLGTWQEAESWLHHLDHLTAPPRAA
ncbi:MAG: hypothetical protein ACRDGS_16645 [Chloroflexota bacterium]